MSGTEGRVYGGDCSLVHVEDGKRSEVGALMAKTLDLRMRIAAETNGSRDASELYGNEAQKLCPGCYMVVGFDMLIHLARSNGQSLRELGATMSKAFHDLMVCGDDADCIESIVVMLDNIKGDANAD